MLWCQERVSAPPHDATANCFSRNFFVKAIWWLNFKHCRIDSIFSTHLHRSQPTTSVWCHQLHRWVGRLDTEDLEDNWVTNLWGWHKIFPTTGSGFAMTIQCGRKIMLQNPICVASLQSHLNKGTIKDWLKILTDEWFWKICSLDSKLMSMETCHGLGLLMSQDSCRDTPSGYSFDWKIHLKWELFWKSKHIYKVISCYIHISTTSLTLILIGSSTQRYKAAMPEGDLASPFGYKLMAALAKVPKPSTAWHQTIFL